jgi:hypothetical protein
MTLTVRSRRDQKHDIYMSMREANACRSGGNEIEIRDTSWNGFEITLENDEFCVDITHKTATNLFRALAGSPNAEHFLYTLFRNHLADVHYKGLWTDLGQKKEDE